MYLMTILVGSKIGSRADEKGFHMLSLHSIQCFNRNCSTVLGNNDVIAAKLCDKLLEMVGLVSFNIVQCVRGVGGEIRPFFCHVVDSSVSD